MAVDRIKSWSIGDPERRRASSWAWRTSSYSVFSMENPSALEALNMRPSSSTQLSTRMPPNISTIFHAGTESVPAAIHRPSSFKDAESVTRIVSCSRMWTSTVRVLMLVGSNTGNRTISPTFRPLPIATRIGTTFDMTGGCESRKLRFCSLPADTIRTSRVVSGSSTPVASKRPTSLSSVNLKFSITSAGLSFTSVRATAIPLWPKAGSSRIITSSSSNPSGSVSNLDVAWPIDRPPMVNV